MLLLFVWSIGESVDDDDLLLFKDEVEDDDDEEEEEWIITFLFFFSLSNRCVLRVVSISSNGIAVSVEVSTLFPSSGIACVRFRVSNEAEEEEAFHMMIFQIPTTFVRPRCSIIY